MAKEAVVLAGGLGTRLRSVVKDVPKPMAEVAGRPFLDFIMFFLAKNNIERAILAVGHKFEVIQEYYSNGASSFGVQIDYSVENEPLGTGGAILQAADQVKGDDFFIVNGDTYFDVNLAELEEFAQAASADIAIALKEVQASQRYGHVECSDADRIVSFKEKGTVEGEHNIINGGVYYMSKDVLGKCSLPDKFSFETDFLQAKLHDIRAYGKLFEGHFIDIGIPEDYSLAQSFLKDVIH
ncbi:MAG: nucleotidyltransferase family protein [Nitrospirota bacterium]